jgi:hypothetical protein
MPHIDFTKINDLVERYLPDMTRFLRDMIRLPSESCQEKGETRANELPLFFHG